MRKVIVATLPDTQGIAQSLEKIDFSDTYATTNHQYSLKEITLKLFSEGPKWVAWLMGVRNYVVRFLGLKSAELDAQDVNFEEGGHIGFFKIYKISENEIILGENDKHLNFRISVHNSGEPHYNIKVTTFIMFNNVLGKIYFNSIKPFHKLIVKSMLKKVYEPVS